MAVYMLRPKKKGSPQSKYPGKVPARSLNALEAAGKVEALATLNWTPALSLLVPIILAVRFVVDDGQ